MRKPRGPLILKPPSLRAHVGGKGVEDETEMVVCGRNIPAILSLLSRTRSETSFLYESLDARHQELLAQALCLLARSKRRELRDIEGRSRPVCWKEFLTKVLPAGIAEFASAPLLSRRVRRDVKWLERAPRAAKGEGGFGDGKELLYVFDCFYFHNRTGGHVPHVRGVIEGFLVNEVPVRMFAPDDHLWREGDRYSLTVIPPRTPFFSNERRVLSYNYLELDRIESILRRDGVRPGCVYNRCHRLSFGAMLLARRLRVPYIVEYNSPLAVIGRDMGMKPSPSDALGDWIERTLIHRADMVIVVSNVLRDMLLEDGVEDSRILVNPNGVNLLRFKRPGIESEAARMRKEILERIGGSFLVGFCGVAEKWHGLDVLARAIGIVASKAPETRFVLVGDGREMPTVRQILRESGMEGRTFLTGLLPFEEVPPILLACDALVSPHRDRISTRPFWGSPTKLFEYMACRKPIVASAVGQMAELLADGETALLVPPENPEALATAIARLSAETDLCERLAERAYLLLIERYTWDAHVRRILDFLIDPETTRVLT